MSKTTKGGNTRSQFKRLVSLLKDVRTLLGSNFLHKLSHSHGTPREFERAGIALGHVLKDTWNQQLPQTQPSFVTFSKNQHLYVCVCVLLFFVVFKRDPQNNGVPFGFRFDLPPRKEKGFQLKKRRAARMKPHDPAHLGTSAGGGVAAHDAQAKAAASHGFQGLWLPMNKPPFLLVFFACSSHSFFLGGGCASLALMRDSDHLGGGGGTPPY